MKKAKELTKEKKHNEYNQAISEKNNFNVKKNEYNDKIKQENENKIHAIMVDRKKYKEKEQKKLIKEEEELKEYYNQKNEKNKRETDKLKAEFEKLEKMELDLQNLINNNNQDISLVTPSKRSSISHYRAKSTITERKKNIIKSPRDKNNSQKNIKNKGNKNESDY